MLLSSSFWTLVTLSVRAVVTVVLLVVVAFIVRVVDIVALVCGHVLVGSMSAWLIRSIQIWGQGRQARAAGYSGTFPTALINSNAPWHGDNWSWSAVAQPLLNTLPRPLWPTPQYPAGATPHVAGTWHD